MRPTSSGSLRCSAGGADRRRRRTGQLVRYQLGQPAFEPWLDAIGPARAASLAAEAAQADGDRMSPDLPRVELLTAQPRAQATAEVTPHCVFWAGRRARRLPSHVRARLARSRRA